MSGNRELPDTRYLMKRAGYAFQNSSNCKKCGVALDWWKTTNGKLLGFNAVPDDNTVMVLHFPVCKPKPAATAPAKDSVDVLVRQLCQRTKARVVAVVLDDATVTFWRNGLDAEELRTELISAGNQVRDDIRKGER